MSFGLRNAPATFQRLMNKVVFGLDGVAVYLDDVITYSDTWAQYVARVRALFQRLADARLTVNLAVRICKSYSHLSGEAGWSRENWCATC